MFIWHFVFIALHSAGYGVSGFPTISSTITIPIFNARRKGPTRNDVQFSERLGAGRVFFSGLIGFLLTFNLKCLN